MIKDRKYYQRRELLNKLAWGIMLVFFLSSVLCSLYGLSRYFIFYHIVAILLGVVVYKLIINIGKLYYLGKNK